MLSQCPRLGLEDLLSLAGHPAAPVGLKLGRAVGGLLADMYIFIVL